jgi:CCR4-NOT transcription complex subunit 7/8
MEKFGEMLISSGLILNDDIKWISFHGAYDFAYLMKVITNQQLPDTESGFLESMETYFPNYYDVRYLVKNNFRGGLSKLAQEFDIARIGSQHQAGSDSVLTAEIYFKIKSQNFFDLKGKNILFGLGEGSEEIETTKFNNNVSEMNNFPSNVNSYPNVYGYEVNPFYGFVYANNVNRGYNNGYTNFSYPANNAYNVQNFNVNPADYSQKSKK